MNILVTGGAGYIGSHTCVALLEKGYHVVVADNLVNSKIDTIEQVQKITNRNITFYNADMTINSDVENIFARHEFYALIHFAGLKVVSESFGKPLQYYYNNVASTLILADACYRFEVKKIIFSSSAIVYGNNESPLVETMPLLPVDNPYGRSKLVSELILTDLASAHRDFSVSLLRYFNPAGAHESGLIGEASQGIPNNLMPYITRVAKGKLPELKIFGNDYPTIDGTGVRDYIHVMDIAEGHVAALEGSEADVIIYNLGTGQGTSVLELVKTFEDANKLNLPYRFVSRRTGDLPVSYADVSKAEKYLGWKAKRNLYQMCSDAWRFEQSSFV